MKEILDFLAELSANNNREWFAEHKEWYQRCYARFVDFSAEYIQRLSELDPSLAVLQPKDCIWRIYRDVRFSNDKRPYKTHMGAYICPGGKKSGFSGYYFHLGVGGEGYPAAHMLAAGDYMCDPKVLKILREDICYGQGDFEEILKTKVAPEFWLDESSALKKVPAGFPADSPYADYLKLRVYCLCYEPNTAFMTAPDMPEKTVELFKSTYPFLQYINRAIEYVKSEL